MAFTRDDTRVVKCVAIVMMLTHRLFLPRLSVLILAWLVALSLAAAWGIGRIEQAAAAPFSRPAPAES